MRFESYQRRQPTINLTSLIDVLFILVVFVMLAASFDDVRGLDVALPGASSEDAHSQERAIVLMVPAAGPMRIQGTAIADHELETRLRALRQERASSEPVLILAADRSISLDRATGILDAASRAGFSAVSIATRGRGQGE